MKKSKNTKKLSIKCNIEVSVPDAWEIIHPDENEDVGCAIIYAYDDNGNKIPIDFMIEAIGWEKCPDHEGWSSIDLPYEISDLIGSPDKMGCSIKLGKEKTYIGD